MLNSLYKTLSKIISPPFCENCKKFIKERTIFCFECLSKITPIISINLAVTPKYSIQVYAVSGYQEPLKSLILAKRFSNKLASKQLAELIWQKSNLINLDFDFFVPIPLHWTRYLKRGFNQSEVIAHELSQKSGKPVENILKRKKYTKFQSDLDVENRKKNLSNAFELIYKNNILEKNIVIVDDLLTSGATLISAAKELAKLKPKTISAIVACRVV